MKSMTAFLPIGVAASAVAWAVALCRENRVCPFGAAARFVRGLPWGGRLAVLPLFVALIVYGSVKQSGVVGDEIGENLDLNRVDRAERADEDETGRADCPQSAETDNCGALGRGEAP